MQYLGRPYNRELYESSLDVTNSGGFRAREGPRGPGPPLLVEYLQKKL